jgi:hypothetical protein
MTSRGERGLRQRRYWEHTIRDDLDCTDGQHASQPSQARSRGGTRRIGRIRRFIGASSAGYILPGWRGGSDEPQQTGERL